MPGPRLSPEGSNEGISNTAIISGLIEHFPPGAKGVDYPERLGFQDGQQALGVAGRVVVSKGSGIWRTRENEKDGIEGTSSHGEAK